MENCRDGEYLKDISDPGDCELPMSLSWKSPVLSFGSRVQLWQRAGHSDWVMKVLVLMADWCSLLVADGSLLSSCSPNCPSCSVLSVQAEVWLLNGVFCSLSGIPHRCVISGFLCWWKISYFIAVRIWFTSIFFYTIILHSEKTEFGDSLTEENDVKSWVKFSQGGTWFTASNSCTYTSADLVTQSCRSCSMWGEEEINVPVYSLQVVETAIPQHSYMGVHSEPSIVWSWVAALNCCPALTVLTEAATMTLLLPLSTKDYGVSVSLHLQSVGWGCFPFGSLGGVLLMRSSHWSVTYRSLLGKGSNWIMSSDHSYTILRQLKCTHVSLWTNIIPYAKPNRYNNGVWRTHSLKCTYTVYDGICFSSYIISEGSSQLPEAETGNTERSFGQEKVLIFLIFLSDGALWPY